ncbi:hypothetical protein [Acinetobacter guillouiae]|uniref:hypothetical protein n=1 Tax=Acinetobacter guillouiae TaxID=106649 RepID=UPI002E1CBB59
MPQYLKIADEIILKINSSTGFSEDPIFNVNLIIKELRGKVKGTNLSLLCNFIDLNEFYRSNETVLKFSLDFSMIPKDIESTEFLLWVSAFIEKITHDNDKKTNDENDCKIIMQRYFENIKSSRKKKMKNDETCDNINSYFKKNSLKKSNQ